MWQFKYISPEVARRCLGFSKRHPNILSYQLLLQKLAIFDFVAPLVASRAHSSILEIGTGLGVHSALLSHYGSVCATELSVPGSFVGADQDVSLARETVFRELSEYPIEFVSNDGRRLPYADACFDVVFHNSVIEHVPDVEKFNREVRRVLKPGGICICITGTPALCRFRLIKDWLLKFPFHVSVAVIRELPFLQKLIIALLTLGGVAKVKCEKIRERLVRVDDRVRAVAGDQVVTSGPALCGHDDLRLLYPRLYHYLYFPEYNRLVVEELAVEAGCPVNELLARVAIHFSKVSNRLRFGLVPRTHGQHYRNVLHEKDEWRVGRWRQHFEKTGFVVEDVRGYRYHHLLELTPFPTWNARIYAFASRWIHAAISRRLFDPAKASEIILVARRHG